MGTRRAAVRPVHAYRVAGRTAKELGNGDPQRPGLDIQKREFDAGHRLGRETAGTRAGGPTHVPEEHLEGSRVATEQFRFEIFHDAQHTEGHLVAAFSPARDALIRLDLDEIPGAPSRVHSEGLDVSDSHGVGKLSPLRGSIHQGNPCAAPSQGGGRSHQGTFDLPAVKHFTKRGR